MRVFHFVNAQHGLDNLRKRRLKIATLHELNDPFEFFGANLADEALRYAFGVMKDELAKTHGLLCFSRDWHNPVIWSHYAARHTGLCLGFEVPDDYFDECFANVVYARRRLVVEAEALAMPTQWSREKAVRFLFTKYSHWRYEKEVRGFVTLEDKDSKKNLYFTQFGKKLRLAQVIVGARSDISRAKLQKALGDLAPLVETFKARLAFKTFRVVRQRKASLWV